MERTTPALIALCLSLVLGHGAAAQMYKWVDENGRVHYSDDPPPDPAHEQLDASLSGGSVNTADPYPPPEQLGVAPTVSSNNPPVKSDSSSIYAGKYRNKLRRRVDKLKNRVRHSPYGGTVTRTTID